MTATPKEKLLGLIRWTRGFRRASHPCHQGFGEGSGPEWPKSSKKQPPEVYAESFARLATHLSFHFALRVGATARRVVPRVDDAAPLTVGIAAPDRHSPPRHLHRFSIGAGHGHFVIAAHVGQLAVRGESHVSRHPMHFEAWDFKAVRHERSESALSFDDRLARRDDHRIVAPVRDRLLDVFAFGRGRRPLRVAREQCGCFGGRIKCRRSAPGPETGCKQNECGCSHHADAIRDCGNGR